MKHTIFSLILFFISTSTFATRKEILLNENWMFRFSHQVQFKSEERVNLPHTWNSGDALSGKQDYYRGMGNYTKTLFVKPEWKGKRLFLRFEGVNTIANVFINDVHIGEHRGGYGAFVFEITDKVKYDADNRILVKVNNALQQDVMPLVGDFNFYGGIYRDENLIITDPVNISLTDYASPGVYLIQNKVTKEELWKGEETYLWFADLYPVCDDWEDALDMEKLLEKKDPVCFVQYEGLKNNIGQLYKMTLADGVEKCFCHGDTYKPNWMIRPDGSVILIDWEYSGYSDPGIDVGYYVVDAMYDFDKAEEFIKEYLQEDYNETTRFHYMAYVAIIAYYWFVWAMYRESCGADMGEALENWRDMAVKYAEYLLK